MDQFRAGSITLAGDKLLIVREGGELVMAQASPAAYRPIATARILPATIRSFPAIANGYMYVRNEKTLVCLNLKAE